MNKILLPHIATMIFNCPLMITQAKLFEILYFLGPNIGLNTKDNDDFAAAASKKYIASEPVYQREEGLAIIPVFGTLMHRDMGLNSLSGNTSYHSLRAELHEALQDKDVKTILLDIDSNGGDVAGVFSLVDEIYRARDQKRIIAIANEAAYSAAYAIGSAASEFYLSRTAGMGSIGVIALHVDTSKQDEEKGLKYTVFYRGAKKIDLNPHYPVTEEAKMEVNAKLDQVYNLFVSTVARNRGISEKAVRDTEAGTFMGDQAVKIGLADGVMDFTDTINFIQSNEGGLKMKFFFKKDDGAEIDINALNEKNEALETENKKLSEDLKASQAKVDELSGKLAEIVKAQAEAEKTAIETEKIRVLGIVDAFAASNLNDLTILCQMVKDGVSIDAARNQLLTILNQKSQAAGIESRVDVTNSGQGNPLIENAKQRAAAFNGIGVN